MVQVAALYVANGGCYSDLAGVEPWDEARDARLYKGPWPVVAHPPCQRWGRFWHGSTRKPHQFKLGDDNGCFAAALAAVRQFGGVLEHPEASHAWRHFGLNAPPRQGGWIAADFDGGWTCCVYQGHYGHFAGKGTWLYAYGVDLPELHWGKCEQRLHPVALAKHGYEKARRIGMMAMVGGKDKTRIRNTTPVPFRDLLIGIVRTASLPLPSTGGVVMHRYLYGWWMFARGVYKARTKKHGAGAQPWANCFKMGACYRHIVDGQFCRPPRFPRWLRTLPSTPPIPSPVCSGVEV